MGKPKSIFKTHSRSIAQNNESHDLGQSQASMILLASSILKEEKNYLESFHLFKEIKNNTCFYFIHSYYADVNSPDIACHLTNHENFLFTSTLQYKRIYATQFHPEKSQNAGITLMKNFFSLKV